MNLRSTLAMMMALNPFIGMARGSKTSEESSSAWHRYERENPYHTSQRLELSPNELEKIRAMSKRDRVAYMKKIRAER